MDNIVVTLFILAMIANAVALARHWRLMRQMRQTLVDLIESQNSYIEMLKDAARRR
jgi:hypothetical protein